MEYFSSVIDLPKTDAFEFFNKHDAYKRANGTKRAEKFLELLVFAQKKLGTKMTLAIIRKETNDDPMSQMFMLATVQRMCL